MRKIITLGALGAMVTLVACTTVSQMEATGGSRSDGVVEMSFDYGAFQKLNIDKDASQAKATAACQAWGYQAAEPFGGALEQCTSMSGYGCMQHHVTVKYQCTGAHTPS